MAPAKPLICGVAAVGTVSTAVVVAHQQGFFSLSGNQTQSSDNATPNVDTTSEQPKPNQKEVEDWLTANKGSEDWKIQIRKGEEKKEFKDPKITEEDLKDLKNYLDSSDKKDLLKSLFSALEPKTLTFEKTSNNWKHILTKENIEKWVEKTSGNKATLKVFEGNTEKGSFNEDESIAIFKAIYDNRNMFANPKGGDVNNKKTIIFEKDGESWKHIKQAIKDWLKSPNEGNNKLKVQIKKSSLITLYWDDTHFKDEDWVGLLKHLKDKKGTYITTGQGQTSVVKKLQKKTTGNNEWELVTS